MELTLALRFGVGAGHFLLGLAVAAWWRAGAGPSLAVLFVLRGAAGLAAAGSHAVASADAAWILFLLAAALSLALVVAAFALALGARRGRVALLGAAATLVVSLVAIAAEPRLYGVLEEAAGVEAEGPLAGLQALVWVAYGGAIARLAREEGQVGRPSARLATRLVLVGFALDVAWVATGALRGLVAGAPPRLLDHLIAEPSGFARAAAFVQIASAAGLLAGAWIVLASARRGRSPLWLAGVLLGALAASLVLRLLVPAGTPLLLVDTLWRLLLPGLVAWALLAAGRGRDAVGEEAEGALE